MVRIILFHVLWMLLLCVNMGLSSIIESQLRRKLFEDNGYNKNSRPTVNEHDSLDVRFGLSLEAIDYLDHEAQLLHTHCRMKYEWTDASLKWDEKEYGDIKRIIIDTEDIWTPPISPYFVQSFDLDSTRTQAIVDSTGKVDWHFHVFISSYCNIDLWKFPYDQHACEINFDSWPYDTTKVNLNVMSMDIYRQGLAYELLDFSSKHYSYHVFSGQYETITYTMQVKRRSSYGSHTYVAPAICIALFLPVIFILPPESKAKITYGTGLMISDVILFMTMVDQIGVSEKTAIPLIAVYYLINLVLIGISMAISALVMAIWSKGEKAKPLPVFVSKILFPMSKILCVSKTDFLHRETGNHERLDEGGDVVEKLSMSQNVFAAEWQQLATVLDRFCFIIYICVVLLCVIVFASM